MNQFKISVVMAEEVVVEAEEAVELVTHSDETRMDSAGVDRLIKAKTDRVHHPDTINQSMDINHGTVTGTALNVMEGKGME